MPNSQSVSASAVAATQVQVCQNAEAITDALSTVEVLTGLLHALESTARGLALRETTLACEAGASEREREKSGALQNEANAAFAELRRAFAALHDGLVLLGRSSAAIGAAAQVLKENGSASAVEPARGCEE